MENGTASPVLVPDHRRYASLKSALESPGLLVKNCIGTGSDPPRQSRPAQMASASGCPSETSAHLFAEKSENVPYSTPFVLPGGLISHAFPPANTPRAAPGRPSWGSNPQQETADDVNYTATPRKLLPSLKVVRIAQAGQSLCVSPADAGGLALQTTGWLTSRGISRVPPMPKAQQDASEVADTLLSPRFVPNPAGVLHVSPFPQASAPKLGSGFSLNLPAGHSDRSMQPCSGGRRPQEGTKLKASATAAEEGAGNAPAISPPPRATSFTAVAGLSLVSRPLESDEAIRREVSQLRGSRPSSGGDFIQPVYASPAPFPVAPTGGVASGPKGASSASSEGGNSSCGVIPGNGAERLGPFVYSVSSDRHPVAASGAPSQGAAPCVLPQAGGSSTADPPRLVSPSLEGLCVQYVKGSPLDAEDRPEDVPRPSVELSPAQVPGSLRQPTQGPPASADLPSQSASTPLQPGPNAAGSAPQAASQQGMGVALTALQPPSAGGRRVLRTEAAARLAATGMYRSIHVHVPKPASPPPSVGSGQAAGSSASEADPQSAPAASSGAYRQFLFPFQWAFSALKKENAAPTDAAKGPGRGASGEASSRRVPALHTRSTTCEDPDAESHSRLSSRLSSGKCIGAALGNPAGPTATRDAPAAHSAAKPAAGEESSSVPVGVKVYAKPGASLHPSVAVAAAAAKPAAVTFYTHLTRGSAPPAVVQDGGAAQTKDLREQGPSGADPHISMHVLRVSLCGKRMILEHKGQLMNSRVGGEVRPLTQADTGVRVEEYKDHRQLVFNMNSQELVPFRDLAILAPISQGSFGTVYQAKWQGRIVAVKQAHGALSQEALRSIAREMNSFRSMSTHPYIVKYLGVCLDKACVGIVMEYLPGRSLFDLLYENKVFVGADRRLHLCRQLVQAVHYMHHEKKLVHRDLKTANLIFHEENGLKLCDFGKTRKLEASGKLLLDDNGGSPRYMAPECFAVGALIDEKADIWGLACCLIEIFGGPIPFEEIHSNEGVIDAIMCKKLRPSVPGWFHPAAKELLERCFALSPRDRPSAWEIAKALDGLTPEDLNKFGMNTRRMR
ncbi:hypothetical protein BESB_023280 [Besnoitia besnoiti]|uniref:Protein kinase domain-containing protein n=1 Tax=Besnoitia besnoiti TaxID=94643 RepID=A0A2A9M7G6_BESBE|nr:hypothetical protein BESB_023280 [Besnoitia besnoiti]PFH31836.1 hypothetical protein BESB_023280 [Besnoitia besnoiti]